MHRVRHGREDVGEATTGDDKGDPDSPSGACVAFRHEADTLLVPRRDVRDGAGLLKKGPVDGDVVVPRDPEDLIDTKAQQGVDQHVSCCADTPR